MAFDMKDYVEVAERIRAWYEMHPEGAIRTEVLEHTEARVTVRAEVFRNVVSHVGAPAGVGHSSLAIPGTTPYTKGSEIENAETSAVGRALVMAGIPSKHVSSSDEVRTKNTGRRTPPASPGKGGSAASTTNPSPGGQPPTTTPAADEGRGTMSPNRAPSEVGASSDEAGVGEGAVSSSGVGDIDTTQDFQDLLIAAVKKAGTLAKVVNRAHKLDPTVRTEADLVGWHLIEITEGKG